MLGIVKRLFSIGRTGGRDRRYLGWFPSEASFRTLHPSGTAGQWAQIAKAGAKDSVWIWDVDGEDWVDTGEQATGDMVGPEGGVSTGELVAFNGTSGKSAKGTGIVSDTVVTTSTNLALERFTLRASDPATPTSDTLLYAYAKKEGIPALGCLLHCDGAHNGTDFIDEVGHAWTAVGNAKTVTDKPRFGTAVLRLPDATSAVTTVSHSDFKPGSLNWTFDAQVFYEAAQGAVQKTIFQQGKDAAGYRSLMIGLGNNDNLAVWAGSDGSWNTLNAAGGDFGTNNAILQVGQWVHLTVLRDGYTIWGYMNGVPVARIRFGQTPNTNPFYDADTGGAGRHTCTIGAARKSDDSHYIGMIGWMDEVRFTKGYAIHPKPGGPDAAYPIPTLYTKDYYGNVRRLEYGGA